MGLQKSPGLREGEAQKRRGSHAGRCGGARFPGRFGRHGTHGTSGYARCWWRLEDVEQMVEKLGPKGAAEAFVKAADHFEKTKDSLPEDERPKPMTATEWKAVLEEEDDMEGEEEELLEGEEEELGEDGEEEGGEDDKGAEEPAAKKAKKDWLWVLVVPAAGSQSRRGGWLANLLEQPLFSEQFVEVSAQALMPLACRKVWYDSLGNCAAIAAAVMRYV